MRGDARNDAPIALHGLVAAHHGGNLAGANWPTPATPTDPSSVLCFTYGLPNSYGHPKPAALTAYANAGWPAAARRDTVGGNIHIYWAPTDPSVVAPCGSACCAAAQR